MASGSFNLTNSAKNSNGSYLAGKVNWSATANASGNYSSVTVDVYTRKVNDSIDITVATDGKWAYSITAGANSKSSTAAKEIVASWVKVASYTSKVPHDANGGKTITIKCSVTAPSGTSFAGLTTSGSKSVTLDAINRVSSVSATSANIGETSIINISRVSSSLTHTLTYSFGSASGTIATKTTKTSVAWTVPTSFYGQIPKAKTGKCTVTCNTYDGSTLVGTTTCTFTATAAKADCVPAVSVSATAVDTNTNTISLTGSDKRIVKGVSTVKVTTTATAKNSASISSIAVTCGSSKGSGSSVTFQKADSATIKATATDSRGYSTTASASGLSLVNYIVPTINTQIKRTSPTSDVVNVGIYGNWFNGNFGAAQNTISVEIRYKKKTESTWGNYVSVGLGLSGNTYSGGLALSGLEYTDAYDVQILATDRLNSISKKVTINRGIPVFDWGENDFQFNVPVIVPRSFYFDDPATGGHGGLDVNNSDIVGLNNLLFRDKSDGPGESIRFYRDGTNWDCVYVTDGVAYITPNYPENTRSYILFHPDNKPYYEAGDSLTLNTTYPGWVSGGSKEFYLQLTLSKPIIASSFTVTGSVVGRGISGYVLDSNTTRIDLAGGAGYAVTLSHQANGVKVIIAYDEAQTLGVVNNTPINWFGTVKIHFS